MTHYNNNDQYALFNSTPIGAYAPDPSDPDTLVRLIHKNEGVGYTQEDLDTMDDDTEGTRVLTYTYQDDNGTYTTLTYDGDIAYYDFPYDEYTTDSYWDALGHDPLIDDNVYTDITWCGNTPARPLDVRTITRDLLTTPEYADYYTTTHHTFVEEAIRNTITDLRITEKYTPALLERIHNHIKEEYI